jgi:hypothetical protein
VTEISSFWGTQQSRCLPPLTWGRKQISLRNAVSSSIWNSWRRTKSHCILFSFHSKLPMTSLLACCGKPTFCPVSSRRCRAQVYAVRIALWCHSASLESAGSCLTRVAVQKRPDRGADPSPQHSRASGECCFSNSRNAQILVKEARYGSEILPSDNTHDFGPRNHLEPIGYRSIPLHFS